MLFTKEQYDDLEKIALDYENQERQVSMIIRELIKITKKVDKLGFANIAATLVLLIETIGEGSDAVTELMQVLYDYDTVTCEVCEGKPAPKEGETAMINPDGSYVTLKELGID